MRVLLLGSTGLLGSEFPALLDAAGVEYAAPTHRELDVLEFGAVDRFFAKEFFDLILYCIAYTDVNKAEVEQGRCELLNVRALENLLSYKIPIIHFSTDYVFDCHHKMEIPEDYTRAPLNAYARSKMQAEQVLERSNMPYWNIRTTWMFGTHGDNFIQKILEKSRTTDPLRVVDDQRGRPTYARDLAEYVVKYFVPKTLPCGHYHVQNSGEPTSWAGLAEYVLGKTSWNGTLERIGSGDYESPARRPKNSVLANTKLPEHMRDWHEAIDTYLKELQLSGTM